MSTQFSDACKKKVSAEKTKRLCGLSQSNNLFKSIHYYVQQTPFPRADWNFWLGFQNSGSGPVEGEFGTGGA